MTDDRELLKLAAKALLIRIWFYGHEVRLLRNNTAAELWNPLIDDGDEARMEAFLCLHVEWGKSEVTVENNTAFASEDYIDHRGDRQAARRRAGVRAAAMIGKSMTTEGTQCA